MAYLKERNLDALIKDLKQPVLGICLGLQLLCNFSEEQNTGCLGIFNTDVKSGGFWLKQIIGGAFITVGMTGLDQEMMQKNLSCRNIREAKKNMFTFSIILLVVNILFLILGVVLCLYASPNGGERAIRVTHSQLPSA